MEEYLIVSCNFGSHVEVVVSGQHVTGSVEQIVEDDVLIAGKWYPIEDVYYAS